MRHKGGSEDIVRVERDDGGYLGDSWAQGLGTVHWAQPCIVSTRERVPRNMSEIRKQAREKVDSNQ